MNTKYKLCWWEENGYHDSYFYGVSFDSATNTLKHESLGATAYGGGIGFDQTHAVPTAEIVEQARLALVPIIRESVMRADAEAVLAPEPFNVLRGREFTLLVPHSIYARDGKGGFRKDENGKRIKITFPAGTVFKSRIDGTRFFGKEYRNGYNHPTRFNSSVSVTFTDAAGTFFIDIPLEKLRQNRDVLTPEAGQRIAEAQSRCLPFARVFGCRSWTCDDWAAKFATEGNPEK